MLQPKQSLHTTRILSYIRDLSEGIGPRGSTTEGERRASEYCQATFEKLGLTTQVEKFKSAKSIFQPHLLASIFMLVAFIIFPVGGVWIRWIALLLTLSSLVSELLELSFKDNLFRRIVAKGDSQNVITIIQPSGNHQQDLILIGHVDSQRTPLIFRSAKWVKAYQLFTTVAFVLFSAQAVFFIIGAITQYPWIWYATIPSAICAVILGAICVQADLTPFTAGANDNASGVGMVLTLVEDLIKKPLRHTRVWVVCSGCEEVQHYGAIDFFKRHRGELVNPKGLVFEMLGCAGPGYLLKEGIVIPFRSDPSLVKLIEKLAANNPSWGAYPVMITGGNTELSDCVQFGVPAITIFGLKPNGEAPYWHQVGDTIDKINPDFIEKSYALSKALIYELDNPSRE